ncbi:MAG: serine hydrolase domain-containing protein [Bacteroidota bacterium]
MKFSILTLIMLSAVSLWGQSDIGKEIDALLIKAIPNEATPGLTVGVVKDAKLLYQNSRGSMNLAYQLPFNDSTVFGLASVSKQFTAACIGVLQHRAALSVQDDVRKYIPELAFYGDTIRIQHLLNHTSGIRNHNVLLDLKGFDYQHRGYTNDMIHALMFRQEGVNNAPGEKMLYSNTNYVLLALIVERVSGQKIHQFAQKELFGPLAMEQTFYQYDLEQIIPNRATPYYKAGPNFKAPKTLTLCVGAGGVQSSISDLAKWAQLFLDPQHEFAYLKSFITQLDTLNNGEMMKHARAMFVSPYRSHTTYNHSGRDIGMRSQFICVPDLNLAVIVYTNSEHLNAVEISYQILDLYMEGSEPEKSTKRPSYHTAIELNSFVGTYQELNSDFRMDIFVTKDTLRALSSFGREAAPLASQGETSFSRIDNASVSYAFTLRGAAATGLQVDFGGAIFYFERVELAPNLNQNLAQFAGEYYSKELAVTYTLGMQGEQLILSYPNHDGLALKEIQKDVLGANRRTKYSFSRNAKGEPISFFVAAEGTVKNILFERLD